MTLVAQCSNDGFLVGYDEDYGGSMPHNCYLDLPEERPGYIAKRNATGDGWEYIENHLEEKGFVDDAPMTITEYGPLPDGWSDTPPIPDPHQVRLAEIDSELRQLDAKSARPLRAILTDTATDEDARTLGSIEERCNELRRERAKLEENNGAE